MDYKTLHFCPNRISPSRDLALPLNDIKHFDSESPDIVRISDEYIYRVSSDSSCYRIHLGNLSETKLFEDNEIANEFLVVDSERLVVPTINGHSVKVYDFCENIKSTRDLGNEVLGFSMNCRIDDGYLVYGIDREDRDSLFFIDTKWELVKAFHFDEPFDAFSYDGDGRVVFHKEGNYVCYDLFRGVELWRKNIENLGVSGPLKNVQTRIHICDGMVVGGSANLYMVGLDVVSGDLVWRRRLKGDVNYPCVDWRGRVYKVTNDIITILNAASGDVVKEDPVKFPDLRDGEEPTLSTAFCDVTETHFFGVTPKGLLYAVNLDTAELEWFEDTDETYQMGRPFLIHGNRLYLQTLMSNKLRVYEGSGGYAPDGE